MTAQAGLAGPGGRLGLHQFLDSVLHRTNTCTRCGVAAAVTVSWPTCSGWRLLGWRRAIGARSVMTGHRMCVCVSEWCIQTLLAVVGRDGISESLRWSATGHAPNNIPLTQRALPWAGASTSATSPTWQQCTCVRVNERLA